MRENTMVFSVPNKEDLDATGRVILEAGRWCKIFYEDGQPEQTDCYYCHEDNDGFVVPIEKNSHAVIHGSVLHLKAKGWRGKAQIKYCPMCGRRLER